MTEPPAGAGTEAASENATEIGTEAVISTGTETETEIVFEPSAAAPRPFRARWSAAVRRCAGLARSNWLFTLVFVVGAVGRLLTTIALSPALLYVDSYNYLQNSVVLDPESSDPLGYPLFLRFLMQHEHGSLAAVVVVQHLLGLAMGLCVYLILRRRHIPKTLSALAAAPVLLDAYQWQIEQNILSDTLFLALITAALALLAWQRRPSPKFAAAAGLILGLAVIVRLVGEITIVPVLLFAVLAAGPRWRRRLGVCAALAVAFAVPVGGYVLYTHAFSGGSFSQPENDNALLYGRAATFADCATLPARFKPICPTGTIAQREALGPDFFANAAPFPVPSDLEHPFANYVITHQPGDFALAVGRDFLQIYISPRQTTFGGTDITRWQYQTVYPPWATDSNLVAVSALRAQGENGTNVNVGLAQFLADYQLNGGYTPGYLFAAFLLLGLAGALGVNRAARRSPLRLEALLWTSTGVCLLLLADLFEFSWRYQLPALVLLPLGGAFGLSALLGLGKPERPKLTVFPDAVDEAAVAEFHERHEHEDPPAEVMIVIAAYNEAEAIGPVLDALPTECLGMAVRTLVVVDGATDDTAKVAIRHGALTCIAPVNRGQGAALRLGYQLARAAGARYVVTTDADGQYDAAALPELLTPLIDGTADFTTGSRILGASETGDAVRQLGCRVFAAIVNVLMRAKVTDTSFGFRAMRAEVPVSLTLAQPQYQSSELLIGILAHGYRVTELPMTIAARGAGTTKKGNNLVYGSRYARVVFGTWWRERGREGPPAAAGYLPGPDGAADVAAAIGVSASSPENSSASSPAGSRTGASGS